MEQLTPMMKQYFEIKENHQDAILFYRLGDFYEMFFSDAELASKELEIVLTGRDAGASGKAPMCGVPYHAAQSYIAKLIKKGYKVAICEQVGDPKLSKGIVKREVVKVITPGTVINDECLEKEKNNYLASLLLLQSRAGLAYVDYSTGELFLSEYNIDDQYFITELIRLAPTEIIVNQHLPQELLYLINTSIKTVITDVPESYFSELAAQRQIKELYNVEDLEELKLGFSYHAIRACGALLKYLGVTQQNSTSHLQRPQLYSTEKYMILDMATIRNLEIMSTLKEQKERGSLLWAIDSTVTAMGSRTIRRWTNQPLVSVELIEERQRAVKQLVDSFTNTAQIRSSLKKVYDLERLIGKLNTGNATPLDLLSLKQSLAVISQIKELLSGYHGKLSSLNQQLDDLTDIVALIENSINPDAIHSIRLGEIIRSGYSTEIDELRQLASDSKKWLMELEEEERIKTGIKSLKIGYNKVFGYYIEVRNSGAHLVPANYQRKQTLANAERYIVDELKELESKILGAEEKLGRLEQEIFSTVKYSIMKANYRIQKTASAIGQVDVLASLAHIALENNYVLPKVLNSDKIVLKAARHPVIEKLQSGQFVANDINMDRDDELIHIITGPNMAGKSTFARTVALITLLAQIGSFVPASYAEIGVVDRIFARVGASDDLTTGQSTFMVEMNEVANILKNATRNSLIILDEVGRGTSTYDGLSIAWAITQHLHDHIQAKTIFTTHYHELTQLEGSLRGVKNYNVLVKEEQDQVKFLYKIIPGCANKSYGIQVAQLAGLPKQLLDNAKHVLMLLEEDKGSQSTAINVGLEGAQITFEGFVEPPGISFELGLLLDELESLNLYNKTPLESLNILASFQDKLRHLRRDRL